MNLSSTILDSKAKPVRRKLRVSTQRKKKGKGNNTDEKTIQKPSQNPDGEDQKLALKTREIIR